MMEYDDCLKSEAHNDHGEEDDGNRATDFFATLREEVKLTFRA